MTIKKSSRPLGAGSVGRFHLIVWASLRSIPSLPGDGDTDSHGGGIHASAFFDEALRFVNTVVTDEAKGIWPQIIAEFEAGRLCRLHKGGLVEPGRIPLGVTKSLRRCADHQVLPHGM